MGRMGFFPILLFILHIVCTDVIADSSCSAETKSTMVKLKRHLLCEYDPDVRPVQNNNNITRVIFWLYPHFFEYYWNDSHLTWDPAEFDDINRVPVFCDICKN